MVTGETVTIDCDELEASRADGTSIRGALDFTGAQRDEWLRLASGNNTIRFTDTGTNDVDVVIRFRGRNTI
jgi:microcompartment protein CcmK/EutM